MLDFVEELILGAAEAWWMPLAVFLLSLIDGFFPVVPSESVLIALASISGVRNGISLTTIFFMGWFGAFIGDQIAYWLGRTIGVKRFRWMRTRSVVRVIGSVQKTLKHSGSLVVMTARHIPGGRVAVNFIAGATRMKVVKFMSLDFVSAAIWAAYSIAIGYFTSGWLENTVLQIALALVLAALLGWLIDRGIKKLIWSRMNKTTPQDAVDDQLA
ncbi:DedA family protein [Yaniella halotolerans]|uniref:DedA family protein n=1 Tax=Yaniella halotolerans TaxID=225453 RepID=UPI0003B7717E|nr:DedA family protein [Yaniella halotolerans]